MVTLKEHNSFYNKRHKEQVKCPASRERIKNTGMNKWDIGYEESAR